MNCCINIWLSYTYYYILIKVELRVWGRGWMWMITGVVYNGVWVNNFAVSIMRQNYNEVTYKDWQHDFSGGSSDPMQNFWVKCVLYNHTGCGCKSHKNAVFSMGSIFLNMATAMYYMVENVALTRHEWCILRKIPPFCPSLLGMKVYWLECGCHSLLCGSKLCPLS